MFHLILTLFFEKNVLPFCIDNQKNIYSDLYYIFKINILQHILLLKLDA